MNPSSSTWNSYFSALKSRLSRFCRSKRERHAPLPSRRRHALTVEFLEERLTPSSDLSYNVIDPALKALTLQVANGQVQIVNSQDPTVVLAGQQLSTTSSVHIASSLNVALTIDATVPRLPRGIFFDGTGSTASTLIGPAHSPDIAVSSLTTVRSATGDTLTRTDGGTWADSGLVAGDAITLLGSTTSPSNNGTYTIKNVQGNDLVLTVANAITAGTETNVTIRGTGTQTDINNWAVTGANSGNLDGTDYVNFTNVQNLTASSSSDDRFDLKPGGSLSGMVTGNVAQNDTIYVTVAAGPMAQSVGFEETSQPDDSLLDTWTINDLPVVKSVNVNLPNNLIIPDGTTGDNQSVLAKSTLAGMLQLTSTSTTPAFQPVTFDQPSGLLEIQLGTGNDTLS